jgi:phosphate-selective porin OprO/OprP
MADGTRYRIAPQAYYYYGRLGLLGEYVLSSQQVRNSLTNQLYAPKNTGFHVQGSFLLTRDKASYNAVVPTHNFDRANGTYGAFELAARYTELRVDRGVYEQGIGGGIAQKAEAWALGLNWYLNRTVRLMFHYEQTDFVARPGGEEVPAEKVFLQRLQLRF